jgi:hypothetical protein
MSIEKQNDLLTALLHVMPSAEVRHFSILMKAAETVTDMNIKEVIGLVRSGAVKI